MHHCVALPWDTETEIMHHCVALPWDTETEIMHHCVALPWDTETGCRAPTGTQFPCQEPRSAAVYHILAHQKTNTTT